MKTHERSTDASRREARYRIAVDTGGTFTDVVVGSNTGDMAVGKALTTYDRVFTGFEASVRRAAESVGWSGDDVLRNADVIVYGTTHATNAVLTGKVAKTALLTTDGFADTLLLREGGRRDAFDSKAAYPPPYIPRHLTFEIQERISAEGERARPVGRRPGARHSPFLQGSGNRGGCRLVPLVDHQRRARAPHRGTHQGDPAWCSVHALQRSQPDHPRVPTFLGRLDRRVPEAARWRTTWASSRSDLAGVRVRR